MLNNYEMAKMENKIKIKKCQIKHKNILLLLKNLINSPKKIQNKKYKNTLAAHQTSTIIAIIQDHPQATTTT